MLGPALVDERSRQRRAGRPTIVPAATRRADELARDRARSRSTASCDPGGRADDGGEIVYRGDNATNQAVEIDAARRCSTGGRAARARRPSRHRPASRSTTLLAPPNVRRAATPTARPRARSGGAMFLIGYIIAFILYMVITLYGVNVMRSVVTEKTSRVVELMVAATKPRSMMTGKILGVGGAGLVQISSGSSFGAIALAYRDAAPRLRSASARRRCALPSLSARREFVDRHRCTSSSASSSTRRCTPRSARWSRRSRTRQQAQMPVTMLLVIGDAVDDRGHQRSRAARRPRS